MNDVPLDDRTSDMLMEEATKEIPSVSSQPSAIWRYQSAVFPGVQGSIHTQVIAAKAVCLGEA